MRRYTSDEMMQYSKTMCVAKCNCAGEFAFHTHGFIFSDFCAVH